jgi:Peptidase M15.
MSDSRVTNYQLTPHFNYLEATHSSKGEELGIDNTPNDEELATIHRTALSMETVRKVLGDNPIVIYPDHSWYRGPGVNKAVGGVPGSQHSRGEAVDFVCPGYGSNVNIVQKLIAQGHNINYDQLILEPTWVHISFCNSNQSRKRLPRLQYLDLSSTSSKG